MLDAFNNWLSATGLSVTIQNVLWIVPATQSLHYLALAVVLTSIAMLDVRLIGVAGRSQSVVHLAGRLLPAVWWALLVMAITGVILIVGEPHRSLNSETFWLKMFLLAVVLLMTLVVQISMKGDPDKWERGARGAKLIGATSLVLWIGIVTAGRWIAYT
jgi:uncharacterized membrane protein SirB2